MVAVPSSSNHGGGDRRAAPSARLREWRPGGLRHPGGSAESCCLPALTRFTGSRCTGPGRHTPRRAQATTRYPQQSAPACAGPGGLPERPNGHAWKACEARASVGSNPTPSAQGPADFFGDQTARDSLGMVLLLLAAGASGLLSALALTLSSPVPGDRNSLSLRARGEAGGRGSLRSGRGPVALEALSH